MENWRAGYLETGTSGSEGSSVKPGMATYQGARFLPYGWDELEVVVTGVQVVKAVKACTIRGCCI